MSRSAVGFPCWTVRFPSPACLRMSLQAEDLVSYTGARTAPMKRLLFAALIAAIPRYFSSAPVLSAAACRPKACTAVAAAPKPVASHAPAAPVFGAAEQTAMVKQYCTGCHSDRGKAGQLSLASFDASNAANPDHVATTEKMIRKLRAGMMPPAGARRPEADADHGAGRRRSRRASIAPRSSIPIPARVRSSASTAPSTAARSRTCSASTSTSPACCRADTISNGFDNVADAQAFSATLMESYLRAAAKVTALAIGDKEAAATETNYRVPKTASQLSRVDGAPFGTRGGISVPHTFPADGDYVFKVELHSNACGVLFGGPNEGETGRSLGRRRAQGAHEDRSAHGRDDDRPVAEDAADSHHGRRASRDRGVHPALRRPGQRSDRADRSHAGRHADRRRGRHHHAPARQGLQHRRSLQRDRHFGHGEPPQDLHVPADVGGRRSGVRRQDRARHGDAGVPRPGERARLHRPDEVLHGQPQGRRFRVRDRRRDRSDPREPAVPVPPREHAGDAARGAVVPAERSGAGVAAVVFHLGHGARRRAGEARVAPAA